MEMLKKNSWGTYGSSFGKDYELFGLRFYNIYQLFASHNLKVESENAILGFLFHYTKVMAARRHSTQQGLAYIVDFLSSVIRLYYVSTSKVLSAYRDNDHFRQSSIFQHLVKEEFRQRVVLPHHSMLSLNLNGSGSAQK